MLIAEIAMGVEEDAQAEYSYTINNSTIINKIKNGIKIIRENGFDSELVILANYDTTTAIEEAVLGKITSGTFSQGGINTKVPFIDDCPIISVPKARMYSAITLKDGSTGGQEDGGYTKGSSAKDINFIIVARETPIAVTKQDKMRIFTPDTYQKANAWSIDYRRYHDLWVKDNCKGSIFVNIKDAKE